MDVEEIKEVPEFSHDIDPYTYSKIPVEFRELAETISKLRQEVRWVGQNSITARNISVQMEKKMTKIIYSGAGLVLAECARLFLGLVIVHKP